MSLILDALKRAERERQAPASAALGELPPPRARRGFRLPWRALVVVALIAVAFAGWKKFRASRAAATTASVQPAPPQPAPIIASPAPAPTPAPAAPSAQTPIIASPPRAPSVIPGTEGMTSLEEIAQGEPEPELAQPAPAPQPKPAAPTAPPRSAPMKPAPTPAPAPKAAAPAPRAAPSQPQPATPPPSAAIDETPAPPAEEPAEAPAPAPEAAPAEPPREISPALTQPAPYRKLKEMPPDYRADFPQVTIEVHVYQQIPAQRFVIINGRRYRQGDTLAEGPQIVEIVPDGIVVDYRNERLLLPLTR